MSVFSWGLYQGLEGVNYDVPYKRHFMHISIDYMPI
jgi:hypothetical protein